MSDKQWVEVARERLSRKLKMSVSDNFASFVDKESGLAVLVESFDNQEFAVRIGSLESSQFVGTIRTDSSETLNQELAALLRRTRAG